MTGTSLPDAVDSRDQHPTQRPLSDDKHQLHRYHVFGLHFACEFPLPNLDKRIDTSGAEPDVVICLGPAEDLPPRDDPRQFDVDPDGVTLTMYGTARYRVEEGRRVTITPHHNASERDMILFLLGSVIGIICHQRSLLPLHASAIVENGRAIAFCGHSGIGKSTLVSHLAARGHIMLCDDVCVVNFDESGHPYARAGLPTARLWADAAEQLGHDCDQLDLVMDGRDKYHTEGPTTLDRGPVRLDRIYVLTDGREEDEPPFAPLKGVGAVQRLINETYRKVYLEPMDLFGDTVKRVSQIARHTELYMMNLRRGYDVLAAEIDLLERHWGPSVSAAKPDGSPLEQKD